MSNDTSLLYYSDKLGKTIPRCLTLQWQITGAKTVVPLYPGLPVYTTFDAIAAQSTIDNFLGTTNEFLISQFDATAMGADTFGGIVNMLGQGGKLGAMEDMCYSATGGGTLVTRAVVSSTTLTASTLATECALGAFGNMAFKIDFGNTPDFDGLTSGMIIVKLYWIAK